MAAAAVPVSPMPQAPFAQAMSYQSQGGRSLPGSPRSSFSSLSPPPPITITHRPPSRSSLYPSRSSPTLPALAEDSISSLEPLPSNVRPLSVLMDDAYRMDALSLAKTPDHVDHMNSSDPFGSMWHNDSPYDVALPPMPTYSPRSRPGSMIFPPGTPADAYSSVTFPRSRRNSVMMPSPLSQATSAASFESPSSASLHTLPSPSKKRISFMIDPLDDYPMTHEEMLFAHVQNAKQERRDALLHAQEQAALERAQRLAEEEARRKKGLFGLFRRSKGRSVSEPIPEPVSVKKAKSQKKSKKQAEKEAKKEQQAQALAQEKAKEEDNAPKRRVSHSFSILSRRGTAKLKRRPSEKRALMPEDASVRIAAASSSTLVFSAEPVVPEYRTTPFDPSAVSPIPSRSPAPAYTLVDPSSVPLPPSPEVELPESDFLPPPGAPFMRSERPSLPSLQHSSHDGSMTDRDEYGDNESSEAEAVRTPEEAPATPMEGAKQGELIEAAAQQMRGAQVTVPPVAVGASA